jgi:acyl phosphate:glycerol-3-phosphate acyltransferase
MSVDTARLIAAGVVPAYLLGTFPSALLVARSKGVDITAVGSGNPGASNVARVLGTAWGVVVFVLDGVKGAIPAVVGLVAGSRGGAYALVGAAILGHMYPITRRFRGGKGVATLGGAMIIVHPFTSAVLLAVWYAVRRLSRTASVASLVIAVALPIGVGIERARAWEVVATIGLSALVLVRHVDNIRRLLAGRELSARGSDG